MSDEPVAIAPEDAVQKRLQELKITFDEGIAYRYESVFPKVTGWGSTGEIKRRAKLIRFVEPTLKQMLLRGEEILFVAKGVQYCRGESFLMGALWSSMLNQTVFVLTNARLLMMRSNRNGKPLEMFWQVYYSEIRDFKAPWSGILTLKMRDGKKLKFTGFPSGDRKSMPAIFQKALEDYRKHGFEPTATQSRENLCCHCFKVVPKEDFTCAECGAEYWTPRQLALRSLVFPSWGDICMKHYLFACFELAGYLFSWFIAIERYLKNDIEGALRMIIVIFLIEHTLDAFLTYTVASKGLNHRWTPIGDEADSEVDADQANVREEFA